MECSFVQNVRFWYCKRGIKSESKVHKCNVELAFLIALCICNCYLKVFKREELQNYTKLWFLCSTHHLMILNICLKFQEDILTVFMSSSDMILSQNCF